MKATIWIVGVLAAGALALTACKKAPPPPPPAAGTVVIDLQGLQAAFPKPTREIQLSLEGIGYGLRYEDYNKALTELDKLASTPGLTEQQKKVVSEVTEQVKKTAASRAANAGR
jgi:hypothetical protein